MNKVQSQSLKIYAVGSACCASDVRALDGCRYDIERLGCRFVDDWSDVDVLLIYGGLTPELQQELQNRRAKMKPHYSIAIGACACAGSVEADVFVPGCPPRPEAMIRGLLEIQRRIDESAGS